MGEKSRSNSTYHHKTNAWKPGINFDTSTICLNLHNTLDRDEKIALDNLINKYLPQGGKLKPSKINSTPYQVEMILADRSIKTFAIYINSTIVKKPSSSKTINITDRNELKKPLNQKILIALTQKYMQNKNKIKHNNKTSDRPYTVKIDHKTYKVTITGSIHQDKDFYTISIPKSAGGVLCQKSSISSGGTRTIRKAIAFEIKNEQLKVFAKDYVRNTETIDHNAYEELENKQFDKNEKISLHEYEVQIAKKALAPNKLTYSSRMKGSNQGKKLKVTTVMPNFGHTNLHDYIEQTNYDYMFALFSIKRMIEAKLNLDSLGIVQRDNKLEQYFLDKNFNITLGDFDLALDINTNNSYIDSEQSCGTPGFVPPEILMGECASSKGDDFSLAMGIWLMLGGRKHPNSMFKNLADLAVNQYKDQNTLINFINDCYNNKKTLAVDNLNDSLIMKNFDSEDRVAIKTALQDGLNFNPKARKSLEPLLKIVNQLIIKKLPEYIHQANLTLTNTISNYSKSFEKVSKSKSDDDERDQVLLTLNTYGREINSIIAKLAQPALKNKAVDKQELKKIYDELKQKLEKADHYINNKKESLKTHRNILKRSISAVFAKPRTYRRAKEMQQSLQEINKIFNNSPAMNQK